MYWFYFFIWKSELTVLVLQDLIAGFDQEAAAVVMARLVSFKMETEVTNNILHGSVHKISGP